MITDKKLDDNWSKVRWLIWWPIKNWMTIGHFLLLLLLLFSSIFCILSVESITGYRWTWDSPIRGVSWATHVGGGGEEKGKTTYHLYLCYYINLSVDLGGARGKMQLTGGIQYHKLITIGLAIRGNTVVLSLLISHNYIYYSFLTIVDLFKKQD